MMRGPILVVEDDEDVRDFLAEGLQMAGYETLTAVDGVDGLDKVAARQPALVLLDLLMPQLDGYGFLAELERRGLRAAFPVIVLSAWGSREQAIRLGAACYLSKPVLIDKVLSEMAQLLAE